MNAGRLSVVYIAGCGRSGSTLLARLLGEISGFVNVGEAVAYLYNGRLRRRDIPCGCGEKIPDCSFWRDVYLRIDRREYPNVLAFHAAWLANVARVRLMKSRRWKRVLKRALKITAARPWASPSPRSDSRVAGALCIRGDRR